MTNDSTYNLFTIILVVDRTLLHVVELTTTYLSRWNWTQVATSLSLLKQQKYDRISNLQLQSTDVQLKTYTGEVLQTLGKAMVKVNYGEQTQN